MADQNPSLRPIFHSYVQPTVNTRTNVVQPLNISVNMPPVMNEFNTPRISAIDNTLTESLYSHQCNNLTIVLGSTETALLETRRQLFDAINMQQYYLNIINVLRATIRQNEIEILTLTNHNIELTNELEDMRGTDTLLDMLNETEERQEERARQIPSSTIEVDE